MTLPQPLPQKEWLRRCSSMIWSQRIVNLKEQSYLCSSLMQEKKENVGVFLSLLWQDPLRWLYGLVLYTYLEYISLSTAALTNKQFDKSCFSSADDGREKHLNVILQFPPDAPELLMTEISELHSATYNSFLSDFEYIINFLSLCIRFRFGLGLVWGLVSSLGSCWGSGSG